jgi:hypothetical protein
VIQFSAKLIMLISVFIITGHNMLPHGHHVANQTHLEMNHHHHGDAHDSDHQHNSEDNQHSVFSFIQLDEEFFPSQFNTVKSPFFQNEIIIPETVLQIGFIAKGFKRPTTYYDRFQPPENFYSIFFSRPPPSANIS